MIEIMSKHDEKELLELVVEKIPEIVYGKGCSIFLKKNEDERFYLAASRGLSKKLIGKASYAPGEGLTGWVLKTGCILNIKIHKDRTTRNKAVKDISQDLIWKSKYQEFKRDSRDPAGRPFLAAPLKTEDGRILGALRVSMRTEEGNFTSDDESLLKACADQIVASLERMRITSDLKSRIEQLRLFSDITAELARERSLENQLDRIAKKAAVISQCRGITIWLRDEEKKRVVLRAAYGPHKKEEFINTHFHEIGKGLTGQVAQTGKPIWEAKAHDLPGWEGKYNAEIGEKPPGRIPIIILPLKIARDIFGVIKFTRKKGRPKRNEIVPEFTEDEFNLAWVVSRQIAFVIYSMKMLENLVETIDELKVAQKKIFKERENAWKEFSANTAHRIGTEVADFGGALYWLKKSVNIYSNSYKKLTNEINKFEKELNEEIENKFENLEDSDIHKIKTDISQIGGALYWLKDFMSKFNEDDIAGYLTRIEQALGRMKSNVSDFTEFSKPPEMKFESINLNNLFDKLIKDMTLDYVKFHLNFDDKLPNIKGDKASLTYAFKELLRNAEKAFTDQSNRKIIVKTKYNKKLGKILIYINDNGPGIPANIKEKIFNIGFRNRSGGTGLGLAIVKRYVEQHNGTIIENGTEGKGAHFKVQLPVLK
jgi:signal transduction histidine kinase